MTARNSTPLRPGSSAFNRAERWDGDHVAQVCLDIEESEEFADIIEAVVAEHSDDFASGLIMEQPDRLWRLAHYYLAANGVRDFPTVRCEAPWVSTVIETDGTVRPYFFHAPIGNIHEGGLDAILNSGKAIALREELNISSDPICSRLCAPTIDDADEIMILPARASFTHHHPKQPTRRNNPLLLTRRS